MPQVLETRADDGGGVIGVSDQSWKDTADKLIAAGHRLVDKITGEEIKPDAFWVNRTDLPED